MPMSTLCLCCWRRMGWTTRPPAQGTPCLFCGAQAQVHTGSYVCVKVHIIPIDSLVLRERGYGADLARPEEPCRSYIMHGYNLSLLCLSPRAACACHFALQSPACVMHERAMTLCAVNAQATTTASTRARTVRAP